MKMFLSTNWFMFRVSLAVSLSMFILTGFDFTALGLIPFVMIISLLLSLLFWKKD